MDNQIDNHGDQLERRMERRRGERRRSGAAGEACIVDPTLKNRVIDALRAVFDPEIPVNIYDLGLIYALDIDNAGNVFIRMTLTAAACPVAHTFPATVCDTVQAVDGIGDVEVELVWDPPWSREMMSEGARLQLGLM
jgi:FeS assembly SUF system protein